MSAVMKSAGDPSVVVDDSRATGDFVSRHWVKVWGYASPLALSGNGTASCAL
jgi:hypothetical protein